MRELVFPSNVEALPPSIEADARRTGNRQEAQEHLTSCDDHVPRDGHAVLAGAGGGGDGSVTAKLRHVRAADRRRRYYRKLRNSLSQSCWQVPLPRSAFVSARNEPGSRAKARSFLWPWAVRGPCCHRIHTCRPEMALASGRRIAQPARGGEREQSGSDQCSRRGCRGDPDHFEGGPEV
jgi:hypothetical protein